MGERDVSWDNMENMMKIEKMENINQMTQNTLFTTLIATVEKVIKYALGEHDRGSAQVERTSSEMWSPGRRTQD